MEEVGSIVSIYFDNGTVLDVCSGIRTQEMNNTIQGLIDEYRTEAAEGRPCYKDLIIEDVEKGKIVRVPVEKLSSLVVEVSPKLGYPLL